MLMRMTGIRFATIFLLILLSISSVNGQYSQSSSPGAVAASRVVPLTIKIVLLGFSSTDLNSSYLTSGIDQIPLKYQQILQGPINSGVMFNFTYQYVYEKPNSTLVQSLAQYLNSIVREQDTVPGQTINRLNNPALNNTGTRVTRVHNYFYDASKVENWLTSNQTLSGAVPTAGYTLFIADLSSKIPSFSYQEYQAYNTRCPAVCTMNQTANPHYYNRTVTDPDLGLQ